MVRNKGNIGIVTLLRTSFVSLALLLTSNVFKIDMNNPKVLGVQLASSCFGCYCKSSKLSKTACPCGCTPSTGGGYCTKCESTAPSVSTPTVITPPPTTQISPSTPSVSTDPFKSLNSLNLDSFTSKTCECECDGVLYCSDGSSYGSCNIPSSCNVVIVPNTTPKAPSTTPTPPPLTVASSTTPVISVTAPCDKDPINCNNSAIPTLLNNASVDSSKPTTSQNAVITTDPNTGKPRIITNSIEDYANAYKIYCNDPKNNCSAPELLPSHLNATVKYTKKNAINDEFIPEATPIPGGAVPTQSVSPLYLKSIDIDPKFSGLILADAKQKYTSPIPVKVEVSVVDPAYAFVSSVSEMENEKRRINYYAQISSGYRSQAYQALLYQNRTTTDVAKPGYSQHQTGLAIDVKSNLPTENLRELANQTGFIEPFYKPQYGSDRGHFYCLECKYPGLIETMKKSGYSTAQINDIGTMNKVLLMMGEQPEPIQTNTKVNP